MSDSTWYREETELLRALRSHDFPDSAPTVEGYEDIAEIARGGQGQVYRAFQVSTRRKVAIKVLFPDAQDLSQRKARFEREVELLGALHHPNIVRIYDGGVLGDGRLYTVMEFVDGIRLDDYVNEQNLNKKQIVQLLLEICDALSYSHRKGVIHRDIKPGNILVDVDGSPRILDFGIARLVGESDGSTKTGQFVGTMAYASPEQINMDPLAIDTRTDIYSLGVVLYQLLAKKLPYSTDGPVAATVQAIQSAVPPPPSNVSTSCDKELDAVVLHALEKSPDERYTTIESFANDLQRYLDGEPLHAKRHRKWYVVGKTIQRHRWSFSAAVLAVLLLVVFSSTVTALWQRAVSVEQKAREINVFWEDTLASVSPKRAGEPITFRDVLDEAVQWVAITTEDRPEVEASLRTTIGNGYRNLGHYDLAESQLQRALLVRQEHFGDEHREVIQSLNSIALLRKSQGDGEEAERMLLQVLDLRRNRLGRRHADVAMSLQNLGRLYMENGDLEEAADYFNESLSIRMDRFSADDPAIATVLFDQAELASRRVLWDEAKQLHERALIIRQSRLAPTHPDIWRSMIALGRVCYSSGDQSQARELIERAKALQLQTLDPLHAAVIETDELLDEIGEDG